MGKNLLQLDQAATLSGIGHFATDEDATTSGNRRSSGRRKSRSRAAKRQRVSVLKDELSKLSLENDDSVETLENIYELAKLSPTDAFFKDFAQADGIRQVLEFFRKDSHDPNSISVGAKLTYLCTMRGPNAKDVSDAFVRYGGVSIFREINANLFASKQKKTLPLETKMGEGIYKASCDVWTSLGMIFCKSGDLLDQKEQMRSIDAILDAMDHLRSVTVTNPVEKEASNIAPDRACKHATKALHGAYRALNYLIDHVQIFPRKRVDEANIFQRCHALSRIPNTGNYKTDDATIFLNTKIFFVSVFQKGWLRTKQDYEEVLPLCVETIRRNSTKASKNVRAQDRRQCVFELAKQACGKVHKTSLEQSGMLGAIEMTLLATGTVKSKSKEQARELLKEIAARL